MTKMQLATAGVLKDGAVHQMIDASPSLYATPRAIRERIDAMLNKCGSRLAELRDRWQDEKNYEDFADYVAVMQAWIPADFKFVAGSKRPFGFTFEATFAEVTAVYSMTADSRSVKWMRVSIRAKS